MSDNDKKDEEKPKEKKNTPASAKTIKRKKKTGPSGIQKIPTG